MSTDTDLSLFKEEMCHFSHEQRTLVVMLESSKCLK